MTRRNEDSGLIDLDALMREAKAGEDSAAEAQPPEKTAAPSEKTAAPPEKTAAPPEKTAAPSARASTPPARASAPPVAPTPPPAALRPETLVKARAAEEPGPATPPPTVRPPALVARQSTPSSAEVGDQLRISSIASDAAPAPRAAVATTERARIAKIVPPAPVTMPSKLEPDSLDALTTEPPTSRRSAAPSAAPPAPSSVAAPKKAEPARGRAGLAVGAMLAVAALVGVGVFMRSQRTTASVPATAAAPARAPSVDDAPKTAAAPTVNDEAPSAPGLSADELPVAETETETETPATSPTPAGARAAAKAKPAGPAPVATLTETALASSGPSAAGDLGDAMRGAVGPREQEEAAAAAKASGPNAAQVRPSPGAVVGALGSVLPEARACLSPEEPARSGLVVFKSDGTVARVEIRGSKPEDDCVRSALSKAKVAPFVDETFSTRVTVRP